MNSKVLGRTTLLLGMLLVGIASSSAVASFLPDGVDLWFSTSVPTIAISPTNGFKYMGSGSVMSTNGSEVASNQSLLAKFKPSGNFIPFFNNKGLDALAISGTAKKKTIVFSVNTGFYSQALGRQISDGDLLNNRGEIVATQHDLLAALQPKDAGANYGLDAAYIRSSSGPGGAPEIWFSTDRSFYSNALARQVSSGDVVSNTGEMVVSFEDLMAGFDPRGGLRSLSLDTFMPIFDDKGAVTSYVFSTNERFYSNTLKRWISGNDLIRNDGTIAMTQKEITSKYGLLIPICKDFRLDACAFNIPQGEERRVPEPASLGLLTLGLLSLIRRRR